MQVPSLCVVGPVTLVQAAQTKEAIASARRTRGRRRFIGVDPVYFECWAGFLAGTSARHSTVAGRTVNSHFVSVFLSFVTHPAPPFAWTSSPFSREIGRAR